MNIENYITMQYKELMTVCSVNTEYSILYAGINHQKLNEMLNTLHYQLVELFTRMNERLPTGDYEAHYWAEPSRQLNKVIDISLGLYNTLQQSEYAFEVDDYYLDLMKKCRSFLRTSGGSNIPPNMEKIELYYTIPIFTLKNMITKNASQGKASFPLKQIGIGSYAIVYKYRDPFYNRNFVIKRAKKDLTEKELMRFKREYDEMNEFSSPYIVEVYSYNGTNNEYIMEFMDYTLDEYIAKQNTKLTKEMRRNIVNQILRAFRYIHSRGRLHRDISPKNILIKEYHDTIVVKISDFGLVKVPESTLTSSNTTFKGYFNDPDLVVEGFNSYNILHETYALTRVVFFVLTGRMNVDRIENSKLRDFVKKGLSSDKKTMFNNVDEIIQAYGEAIQ